MTNFYAQLQHLRDFRDIQGNREKPLRYCHYNDKTLLVFVDENPCSGAWHIHPDAYPELVRMGATYAPNEVVELSPASSDQPQMNIKIQNLPSEIYLGGHRYIPDPEWVKTLTEKEDCMDALGNPPLEIKDFATARLEELDLEDFYGAEDFEEPVV